MTYTSLSELRAAYDSKMRVAGGYLHTGRRGSYARQTRKINKWLNAQSCSNSRFEYPVRETEGLWTGEWVCGTCRLPARHNLERILSYASPE